MTSVVLQLENITKSFSNRKVISNISLKVHDGMVLGILGPSGSGKSTLLNIIAGLDAPDSGEVILRDVNMKKTPPQLRGVGYVFQSTSALFPHMTVFENVLFPLQLGLRSNNNDDLVAKVNRMLDLVKMGSHIKKYPWQLSGGEKQRVAIARALGLVDKVLYF